MIKNLPNDLLNTTANDEHIPDIERHIRGIKERVCATFYILLLHRIPRKLLIERVHAPHF